LPVTSFDDPSGAMPPEDASPEGMPPAPDSPSVPPAVPPADAVDPAPLRESLDRRVVPYWLVSSVISWLVLAGLGLVGAVVLRNQWPQAWPFVLTGYLTLVISLLTWSLLWPSLAYNRWRFEVAQELLLARYGIFFIEEKAIPISRLQHVDLYRGLLERFFGLTTLIVFTAGTEGAHFRLPGLSVHRARELRDVILAARGDDVI
jgi:membrane protein YdbS with pleckstrin-like domain